MARTVVKLGRRIIPQSVKRINKVDGEHLKSLSSADLPLKIIAILGAVSSMGAVTLFLINMAFDSTTRMYVFQAAFFGVAGYQLLASTSIVYQYQRCLWAISKLTFDASKSPNGDQAGAAGAASTSDGLNNDNKGWLAALEYAILAMRVQQVIITVTANSTMVLSILFATFVIQLQYWIYCLVFLLVDPLFHASLLLAPLLGRIKARKAHQTTKSLKVATSPDDTASDTRFSSRLSPKNAASSSAQ
jgi:hypothetical protein